MAEHPDFHQIARLLRSAVVLACDHDQPDVAVEAIDAELVKVWNARGAADREALGVEFRRAMVDGGGQIRPEEILKTLDR